MALLDATGAFEAVIPVGRDRARPDIHLAKEEARERGASLLVAASVESPSLRRTERAFALPLALGAFTGFPSMWFHNHAYAMEFPVRLRLHDLNTNDALPERPVVPARAEEQLNFHERTSSVLTYLLTNVFPSPFCPVDEDKVARALLPGARAAPPSSTARGTRRCGTRSAPAARRGFRRSGS